MEFYKFWKWFSDCGSNEKVICIKTYQVFGWLKFRFQVDCLEHGNESKTMTNARNLPCERAKPHEKSLMAVKIVGMHNELSNLNLWISDLRNCWQLLIIIGLHKIVSGGCIVSGCSCYSSKHKLIMDIIVLLTRDPQMRITSFPSKSISVVDRVANSYWI